MNMKYLLSAFAITLLTCAASVAQVLQADDPLEKEIRIIESINAIAPAPLMKEIPGQVTPQQGLNNFEEQSAPLVMDEEEVDLYELISASYQRWWNGTEKNYPAMTLSVMGWEGTSSWGNFGMHEMGRVPRETYNQSHHDRFLMTTPWNNLYSSINLAEQVLAGINNGSSVMDGTGVDVTDQAEGFANFIKGISYGFLAMYYEGGYIYELDDFHFETSVYATSDELKDVAVSYLENAETYSFSGNISPAWIPLNSGPELDEETFGRLLKSYIARIEVLATRDRSGIDWDKIIDLTNEGIEENFVVHADGVLWWSRNHSLAQDPTWMRASYKTIGKYDQSGNYENWLAQDWADRNQILIETPDARIMAQSDIGPISDSEGLDFKYAGPAPFSLARGQYFFSYYHHHRWDEMYFNGFVGPMPHMLVTEMDLYRAEGLLNNGDIAGTVDLINKTRVDRGQLPAADTDHTDEELMEMINYERGIELMNTAAGLNFFDRRNQDMLTAGTTEEFPSDLVSLPRMINPAQNSVNNPTDMSVTVQATTQLFHSIADQFSIWVSPDAGFNDIIFESTFSEEEVHDVTGLQDNQIYYVRLQAHYSSRDLSSQVLTYLFATGLPVSEVADINTSFQENEHDQPLYRVEGVVISPVFNFNGWPSFYLDDGTGGAFVRLDPQYNSFEDVDVKMGDILDVGGTPSRFWNSSLVIHSSGYERLGENQPLPSHVEIGVDQLQDGLEETNNRLVTIPNIHLVDENQWPADSASGTTHIQVQTADSLETFNLVIFAGSELIGTIPPAGSFDLKGVNSYTGILAFHNEDVGFATSIAKEEGLPVEFALQQNYPNPFNPSTNIRFALPQASDVRLEVFNLLGQRVATLLNTPKPAGVHEVTFDASALASGMYVYRIHAGDFVQTRSLMLIK